MKWNLNLARKFKLAKLNELLFIAQKSLLYSEMQYVIFKRLSY